MDAIDYKILHCLRENARQKASAIGEEINLSVSAVLERIRKMEKCGLIEGYTVLLDQKQMGNDMTALMEVSLEHPRFYDSFTAMVRENENIVSCDYLTGDFDFILKIMTDTSESLEGIHRQIKSLDGVSNTRTHFVLKNVKDERTVIPGEIKKEL